VDDPLLPHLVDLMADPGAAGLILVGGYGIRLKQAHLASVDAMTLLDEIPPARATYDLDIFLNMKFLASQTAGQEIRGLIDRLGYIEKQPYWQFSKPLNETMPNREVVLDLIARRPIEDENVKVNPPRVGSGSRTGLHGRLTPEAFAADVNPTSVMLDGTNSKGERLPVEILVPHPYASLNMKIRAAYDWFCKTGDTLPKKAFSEKHAFDVLILVSMLTEKEIENATAIAEQFKDLEIAGEITREAIELFASPSSPGFLEACRQAHYVPDHEIFWEALKRVLGIPTFS